MCFLYMFFCFLFVFSEFIQDKYHYSDSNSAYIAGAAYDVSMILSPFLGFVIVSGKLCT